MKLRKIVATIALLAVSITAFSEIKVSPNPYKNPKQAFQYVHDLVIQKHDNDEWAEYLLASYYVKGYGTTADPISAYVWYKSSSADNYVPAKTAFAAFTKTLSSEQIAEGDKAYTKAMQDLAAGVMADIQYATTH